MGNKKGHQKELNLKPDPSNLRYPLKKKIIAAPVGGWLGERRNSGQGDHSGGCCKLGFDGA